MYENLQSYIESLSGLSAADKKQKLETYISSCPPECAYSMIRYCISVLGTI